MEQKQRKPLVYSRKVGSGVKRYERGKMLEQLLSEGKTLEEAMAQVGVKTVGTARELIRYYRHAVEQCVQSDGVQACPVCLLELDSDGMCPKCFGQYAPSR